MKTRVLQLVLAVLAALALVGCNPGAESPPTASAVRAVDAEQARELIEDGALIVDVRTPEEFSAGHLAGAANLDVQADDFHDRVRQLDPEQSYVVYCRTGTRAAAAAESMVEMGIDDVVNAGGFDDLAAAGIPTR